MRRRIRAGKRREPSPLLARSPSRPSLLLSTALVSTLLIGGLFAPAAAQPVLCPGTPPPGNDPIQDTTVLNAEPITCLNNDDRSSGGYAHTIYLQTQGDESFIDLFNTGDLTATQNAVYVITDGDESFINIYNSGYLLAGGNGIRTKTYGYALDDGSSNNTVIVNEGNIQAGPYSYGILAEVGSSTINSAAAGADSSVAIIIDNSGNIGSSIGIRARTYSSATGENSDTSITINNEGVLNSANIGIHGISTGAASGLGSDAGIVITNENTITAYNNAIFTRHYSGDATGENSNVGIYIRNESTLNAGQSSIVGINSSDASGDGSAADVTIMNAGALNAARRGINATTSGEASGDGSDAGIVIFNEGIITSETGIFASTSGDATGDDSNAGIVITNEAAINASVHGIYAETAGDANGADANTGIAVTNEGTLLVYGGYDTAIFGIYARTEGIRSHVVVNNSGNVVATGSYGNYVRAYGVYTRAYGTYGDGSRITLINRGDIAATVGDGRFASAYGLWARTGDGNTGTGSTINLENFGAVTARAGDGDYVRAYGIVARTNDGESGIVIRNSGSISASVGYGPYASVYGIYARAPGQGSPVYIRNLGDIGVTAGDGLYTSVYGIWSETYGEGSTLRIVNSGDVTTAGGGLGPSAAIAAQTNGPNSHIVIDNSGRLSVTVGSGTSVYAIESAVAGILSSSTYADSSTEIINRGDIAVTVGDGDGRLAGGILALAENDNAPVRITNDGDISVAIGNSNASAYRPTITVGILAVTGYTYNGTGAGSSVDIVNRGDIAVVAANGTGAFGFGILASTVGPNSPVAIDNAGSVVGDTAGLSTFSYTSTTIVNAGYISATSLLAIDGGGAGELLNPGIGRGASVEIFNRGRITGFVNTTDNGDTFLNQAGGVFETKLTSDFAGGDDLFRNEAGGTILAATDPGAREFSAFINLDRFESQGLIALQDGEVGDVFEISNTVGGRDLNFTASGNSRLAVDAFLGPPGSTADNLIINGNVSGKTPLTVFNTNSGPGAANTEGIPVVYVNGNVSSDAFFLPQPIDTGLFIYDLFFEPTGSGIFELRSLPGPTAVVLPQIVTGAHDIWYLSASTWFDRSADLRVFLNGGAAPTAYDPNAYSEGTAAGPSTFTPAVWARGSGSWLDRDGSETVNAFGRAFKFDLERELDVIDFQMGLDLGKRDFIGAGDILVFGMLGGFVGADLDYKKLDRAFDFSGGQVGGYATYLNGGLFVDTLLDVHLLDLETASPGFPRSLDATTVGLRTDTGYRFGGFRGGPFLEPLATLLVTWVDVEGFTLGANRVSFDDDANLRGRLGLRAGTSYSIWGTTTFEPFVIGSLWSHLDGDNQATLVSNGTTFHFEDEYDDVWGEVSAGVNFFNPSAGTAVFAKLDVIFGDDVDGLSGKAGMRVSW